MRNIQCEEISELISGYIDNELTQQKRQLVHLHINSCKECNMLYEELKDLQGDIANLKYPQLEETVIKNLLNEPTSKGIAFIGWIILLCSALGLLICHCISLYLNPNISLLVKILITGIEFGLLLLLVSVFRQRLQSQKTDPYKNVQL